MCKESCHLLPSRVVDRSREDAFFWKRWDASKSGQDITLWVEKGQMRTQCVERFTGGNGRREQLSKSLVEGFFVSF